LRYMIEYLALRIVLATGAALPRRMMLWLGARLGDVLHLTGFYRRIVHRNMTFVGLWSPEEERRITRGLYRTLGKYAADFLRPTTRPLPFRVVNEHVLTEQTVDEHGAVAISAHFGNWELLASFFSQRVADLSLVVKPMKNPLVDRWLTKRRLESGASSIPPRSALRRSLRILRRKGVVAFMIDQYAGSMGTPALFLGKRTKTVRTVAGLVNRTGCGAFGIYALLEDDGAYRVVLQRPPTADCAPNDRDEAVAMLQESHNKMISEWITTYPEHWFGWFHRRFKDVLDYQSPTRSQTVCRSHEESGIGLSEYDLREK